MSERLTKELSTIIAAVKELPPAPATASLREWLTGIAFNSGELMNDVPHELRAIEAVRIADELIVALARDGKKCPTPSPAAKTLPTLNRPHRTSSSAFQHATQILRDASTVKSGHVPGRYTLINDLDFSNNE